MLCSTVALPASAAFNEHEKCPVIFISGSSIPLFDSEGNLVPTGGDLITDGTGGEEIGTDKIIETTMNILMPFILEGLARVASIIRTTFFTGEFPPILR